MSPKTLHSMSDLPRFRAGFLSFTAFLVAVSAIALPGWLILSTPRNASLQALAEQSCRCARHESDEAGKHRCWVSFEKVGATYGDEQMGNMPACAGLVPIKRCFGDTVCVTTGYRAYSPPIAEGQFCSQSEASEAEELGNAYPDETAAAEAVENLSRQFASGDRTATPARKQQGCGN